MTKNTSSEAHDINLIVPSSGEMGVPPPPPPPPPPMPGPGAPMAGRPRVRIVVL